MLESDSSMTSQRAFIRLNKAISDYRYRNHFAQMKQNRQIRRIKVEARNRNLIFNIYICIYNLIYENIDESIQLAYGLIN